MTIKLPGIVVAALVGASFATPALGASTTPVFYEGATNRTCSSFNSTWIELKVDGWGTGTWTEGNLTVTIPNATEDAIDWSSNVGVDAVYLKGGSRGSNLYVYDPESTGDTDLVIPNASNNGISHVSFCWDDDGGGQQQAEPDLAVWKTAYAPEADAGGVVGFNITILNQALPPNDAVNVTLNDTLPALAGGWTLGGQNATDCGIAAGVLTCTFANIPPQEFVYVEVYGTAGAADCGPLDNFVTVTADGDIDPTNNVAWASTFVNCADVGVAKTAWAPRVDVGGTLGFDLVVTSYGPQDSENVTLADTLTDLGANWTLGGVNASECTLVGLALTCAFGTMPNGSTRAITLSVPTDTSDCGWRNNTAAVTADLDVDATNNASTASSYVYCSDLGVSKTAAQGSVPYNSTATFNITVTSYGPDAAENATLTDMLPWTAAGWTLGGADAGSCGLIDRNLTCAFGTLAPNATRVVSLTTTVGGANCGPFSNTASAVATVDTNATNNASTATITVTCIDPHTQGYWKNHASAWPVTSLVLGDETYTKAQLLALLRTSVGADKKADASMILAHQLISAKLNVAAGAPGDVASALIAQADSLLAPYTGKLAYGVAPGSTAGAQMVAVAAQLDAYNNGLLT